jgi:hypothetical protein
MPPFFKKLNAEINLETGCRENVNLKHELKEDSSASK